MFIKCIDDEISNRYGNWTLNKTYEVVVKEEGDYLAKDDDNWTYWVGTKNFREVKQ